MDTASDAEPKNPGTVAARKATSQVWMSISVKAARTCRATARKKTWKELVPDARIASLSCARHRWSHCSSSPDARIAATGPMQIASVSSAKRVPDIVAWLGAVGLDALLTTGASVQARPFAEKPGKEANEISQLAAKFGILPMNTDIHQLRCCIP